MASITKGYTFGSTELVTNAKLHTLVDSATLSGIVNADIDASADILESKLKFDDSSGHTHSGSGSNGTKIDLSAPGAIGGTTPNDGTFDALVGTTIDGSLGSVTPAAIVGTTLKANTSLELATGATVTGIADEDDMSSDSATLLATQQSIKAYTSTMAKMEVFTSSGTFTAPSGVTTVYISGCGGGAGGGGADGSANFGGGGAAGTQIIKYPITVTPAASVTVTINAGGAGGAANTNGSSGGTSVFGSFSISGGAGGVRGNAGGAGGTGTGGLDEGGTGLKGGDGEDRVSGTRGGTGGSSLMGIGGTGGTGTGSSGNGFGSGGSGGGSTNSPGGAGKSGIIIVEW